MTDIVYNKNGVPFDIDAIATDLNGKMDRDGVNATCPTLLSRTPNNQGGVVEIWSDGYCVQTGKFNRANTTSAYTYTINLSVSYIDTNYSIITCGYGTHADTYKNGVSPYSVATNSFVIQTYDNDASQPIVWRAEGYIR